MNTIPNSIVKLCKLPSFAFKFRLLIIRAMSTNGHVFVSAMPFDSNATCCFQRMLKISIDKGGQVHFTRSLMSLLIVTELN